MVTGIYYCCNNLPQVHPTRNHQSSLPVYSAHYVTEACTSLLKDAGYGTFYEKSIQCSLLWSLLHSHVLLYRSFFIELKHYPSSLLSFKNLVLYTNYHRPWPVPESLLQKFPQSSQRVLWFSSLLPPQFDTGFQSQPTRACHLHPVIRFYFQPSCKS